MRIYNSRNLKCLLDLSEEAVTAAVIYNSRNLKCLLDNKKCINFAP